MFDLYDHIHRILSKQRMYFARFEFLNMREICCSWIPMVSTFRIRDSELLSSTKF